MKQWILSLSLAALVLVVCAARAPAGEKDKDAEKAYGRIYDLIYNDEYQQAYDEANKFIQEWPNSKWLPAASYWRCYAFQRTKRAYKDAARCYEEFLSKYGGTRWADDARNEYVKLANRLARAGDPEYKAKLDAMSRSGFSFGYSYHVEQHSDSNSSWESHVYSGNDVRIAALYAILADEGDVGLGTVKQLYESSKEPQLRKQVVYVLSDADDPGAIPFLINIAEHDDNSDVRRQAVYALTDHGDDQRVIDALVHIMKNEKDSDIRRHVLYAIAEVKRPEVTKILVGVATNSKDEDMQRAATYALADVDDPASTQALEEVLQQSASFDIKRAALYALLGRKDAEIMPTLRKLALDKSAGRESRELRRAAVYALGEVKSDAATDALVQVLRESDDPEVMRAALYAIADHQGKQAKGILQEVAVKRDPEMAKAALYGLIDLLDDHDDHDVGVLLDVYHKTPYEEIRRAAVYAIIDMGGKTAVDAIGSILAEESSVDLRYAAVWALADTDSDEAVRILGRVAKEDKSVRVRMAAVQVLRKMDTPAAHKKLSDLMGEE